MTVALLATVALLLVALAGGVCWVRGATAGIAVYGVALGLVVAMIVVLALVAVASHPSFSCSLSNGAYHCVRR